MSLAVLERRSQWHAVSRTYVQPLEDECFRPTGGVGLFIETLIHRLQGNVDTC